jgi:hypothetical protein
MKFATKFMVVPYAPKLENPAETQIFDLDEEMEKILFDKNKNISDKVKLYNQALMSYKNKLDNYRERNYDKLSTVQNIGPVYNSIPNSQETFQNNYEEEIKQKEPEKIKVDESFLFSDDETISKAQNLPKSSKESNLIFDKLVSRKTIIDGTEYTYLVNEKMTDLKFKELIKRHNKPISSDVLLDYMNREGYKELQSTYESSNHSSTKTAKLNDKFIEIYGKIKTKNKATDKNIEDSGLEQTGNGWKFKNFF